MSRARKAQEATDTSAHSIDEEWEEWMDWSNDDPKEEQDLSRESTNGVSPPLLSPQSSKKRKFSSESGESNTTSKAKASLKKTVQDRSHSIVEKRYRENLNQKIADLRNCIPALRKDGKGPQSEEQSPLKQNKATVLTEAMAYIRQLEQRVDFLEQVDGAKKDKSLRDGSSNQADSSSARKTRDAGGHQNRDLGETAGSQHDEEQDPPRGLIPVPEEMRRLWNDGRSQEHYADRISRSYEEDNGGSVSLPGGKFVGRMVFGSLAGIMILDGFAPPQKRVDKRDDRGLSALPLRQIFPASPRIFAIGMDSLRRTPNDLSPLMRLFVAFCVCGLMLFFYLYYSRPSVGKNGHNRNRKSSTSLVSPLIVHQNAWLTSIQTVWVPQRHIFSEMLALNLETAAYLTRLLVGWRCYSWLTGRSEEEEIARVRAWEIALDAQLSGGDPDLSKSRLVLTLWAAGTLPSTPACLMLKALHIRVLFWRPSRFDCLCRFMHRIALSLASWQWSKALELQNVLERYDQSKLLQGNEPLPYHLKALLHESCEEVLNDAAIQRAYNAAWNLPDEEDEQAHDGSSGDSVMLGPLDKLALWHFSSTQAL